MSGDNRAGVLCGDIWWGEIVLIYGGVIVLMQKSKKILKKHLTIKLLCYIIKLLLIKKIKTYERKI